MHVSEETFQNHYCTTNQKPNFIDMLIEMYTKTVM